MSSYVVRQKNAPDHPRWELQLRTGRALVDRVTVVGSRTFAFTRAAKEHAADMLGDLPDGVTRVEVFAMESHGGLGLYQGTVRVRIE